MIDFFDVKVVSLEEYPDFDDREYIVLIYNTFPDEECWKFDKELSQKTDEKYKNFKGLKILFDTHDWGIKDGFARFNDMTTPRIKANPNYELMKKMNIIATIPSLSYSIYAHPKEEREYKLVCAMRKVSLARIQTPEKITKFNPITENISLKDHAKRLCRTLINVVPSGGSEACRSDVDTLSAGALLLAEENLGSVKFLPFIDAKDGVHYVLYNLDNICDKLDWLLSNPLEIDRIRMAGLNAFRDGYNPERSAKELLNKIKSYENY
jgi:hypothetical protein